MKRALSPWNLMSAAILAGIGTWLTYRESPSLGVVIGIAATISITAIVVYRSRMR